MKRDPGHELAPTRLVGGYWVIELTPQPRKPQGTNDYESLNCGKSYLETSDCYMRHVFHETKLSVFGNALRRTRNKQLF